MNSHEQVMSKSGWTTVNQMGESGYNQIVEGRHFVDCGSGVNNDADYSKEGSDNEGGISTAVVMMSSYDEEGT